MIKRLLDTSPITEEPRVVEFIQFLRRRYVADVHIERLCKFFESISRSKMCILWESLYTLGAVTEEIMTELTSTFMHWSKTDQTSQFRLTEVIRTILKTKYAKDIIRDHKLDTAMAESYISQLEEFPSNKDAMLLAGYVICLHTSFSPKLVYYNK
jgi:hypothetical protein